MKRVLSLILVFAMVFTMLPVVSAEETQDARMDMGQVDVAGQGSFGKLLTESISQELEEQNGYGASCVQELTVEGSTATVRYSADRDVVVMVSLYWEDWMEVYTTASTNAPAGEGTVTVEFTEEMPDYFNAAVYLLDGSDLTPVCDAYRTPMYSAVMQDLLASTAADYPAEQVMLLGEDTDTNFAVYQDYVIRVPAEEGVNELVSANHENKVYIFENCDQRLTEMVQWDVLSYEDGAEILIVGVADAQVDGTTVTLYGDDELRLEDVFSQVKVQAGAGLENAEYDGSTAHEGVEDAKLTDSGSTRSVDQEDRRRLEINLNYMDEDLSDNSSFKLQGLASLDLSPELDYYLSDELAWVYLNVHYSLWTSLKLEVQGNAFDGGLALGCLRIKVLPGVHVLFYPEFVVQAKVSASFDFQVDGDVGVALDYYREHWTPSAYQTKPEVTSDIELEGSILVGVNLIPQLTVASGYLLSLEVEALVGFEIKGKIHEQVGKPTESVIHGCRRCMAGEVSFVVKITPSVTVLNRPEMGVTFNNLVDFKLWMTNFYSCSEHDVFLAKGKCPELKYRVTLEVNDAEGLGLANVLVKADGANLGYTASSGTVTAYFAPGAHKIQLQDTISGIDAAFTIQVSRARRFEYTQDQGLTDDGSSDVPASGGSSGGSGGSSTDTREEMEKLRQELFAKIEKRDLPVDYGSYEGPQGNLIRWRLMKDGSLYIEGQGSMGFFQLSGAPWYKYRAQILEVYVEDGITNVADYAFYECSYIKKAHLASTVTEIGKEAFRECHKLTNIYFSPNITHIGEGAFNKCVGLPAVNLPEGLVELGRSAFYGCTGLTSVWFYYDVETIGEYAFYNCSSLESIILPQSMRSIGKGAFTNCTSLYTVFLKEGLETIGEEAFQCSGVGSVDIPASVTEIGAFAFWSCAALRFVEIYDDPAAPTVIGEAAFQNCPSLKELRLHEGLAEIGKSAFADCDTISTVQIPDSVTLVGAHAFQNCDSLSTVEVLDDPAYPTAIGDQVFYNCPVLTTVTLAPGVVSVGHSCFARSPMLETLELPDTVTQTGLLVFNDCTGLTEVKLSAGLTKLEQGMFEGCTSLTRIEIPDSVTETGTQVFLDCSSLTEVKLSAGLTKLERRMFERCTSLARIEIPEGVTKIGIQAFLNCTALTEVELPDSMETISSEAFSGCTALPEIRIPAGVTQLDSDAFLSCRSLSGIWVDEANTEYSSDDQGVVYEGEGDILFLLPLTLEGTYEMAAGVYMIAPSTNLYECQGITELVLSEECNYFTISGKLPENLARITAPEGNLYYDSDSKGVLYGEGYEYIEAVPPAFQGSYEVADTVTFIESDDFCSLPGLTQLRIPGSVEGIDNGAIANCPNLEWVAFLGDFPEMGETAFEGTETWIYYPYENESWQAADQNAAFGDYGGNLLWIPYRTEDEIGVNQPVMSPLPQVTPAPVSTPYPGDMVGGEDYQELYFDGLVPGEQYMVLSLASLEAEDLLGGGNVLFAWQSEADEKGSIALAYYTSRGADGCYAVALGRSELADIGGAEVALEVLETPEQQLLEPVVTLNGETLTIHEDYTIAGEYMAGPGGEYVFTIEGHGDYTGGLRCTLTIPHGWDEGVETIAPAYGAEGEMTYTCATCGETRTEVIPALDTCGHESTELVGASEPDCETDGYTGDTVCTVCGETVDEGERIPAPGHEWSEWAVQTAPTIHAPGEETRSCGVCGDVESREIPMRVNPFKDVAESDWFFEPVLWAFENSITAGDGAADIFNPEGVCTRAQVVTFLWRAAGEPEPQTQGGSFTDVPEGEWFAKAVRWAVEQGITMGTGDGLFSPEDPCTRAQVATFLWRAQGSTQPDSADNPFHDVPAAEYYFTPVLWAVENKITVGTGEGTFSPDETCTRAQIVTFLYRAVS